MAKTLSKNIQQEVSKVTFESLENFRKTPSVGKSENIRTAKLLIVAQAAQNMIDSGFSQREIANTLPGRLNFPDLSELVVKHGEVPTFTEKKIWDWLRANQWWLEPLLKVIALLIA